MSLVIVNYHSEEKLELCLRSIEAQPEAAEVVVADNGSASGARGALEAAHPNLRWLEMSRNCGFAAASNAGARISRAAKLLFLNPDTELARGALGPLIEALETGPCADAILGCQVLDPDGTRQLSCRRFPDWRTFLAGRFSLLTRLAPRNQWSQNYLMSDLDPERVTRVDWVSGAAMAMRRSTFEQVSGFDDAFFLYFEDVDLCRRALDLGIGTWYFPRSRARHQIGGSSSSSPYRSLVYRHRSMWTYYRRHLGRPLVDPAAALLIVGRLAFVSASQALQRTSEGLKAPSLAAED